MADEQTAGTTAQDGGDAAAAPTTGTPEAAGRDAGSEPDYKTLYLEAKTKVERANELETRLKQIEQERAQQTPAAGAADDPQAEISRLEAQAKEFATKGDPVAALILRERAARMEDQRNQALAFQLLAIPDVQERQEVLTRFQRGGYQDINAVREAREREKMTGEIDALRKQLAAAQKKPEVVEVPGQTVRAAPTKAQNGKEQMTASDFQKLVERTREEKGSGAAMALQAELGKSIEIV